MLIEGILHETAGTLWHTLALSTPPLSRQSHQNSEKQDIHP